MRHSWRLHGGTKGAHSGIALSILFTLSACSLPDVNLEKQPWRAQQTGAGFSSKFDDHAGVTQASPGEKTYLATVKLRFSDDSTQSYRLDLHRDRRDFVALRMLESAQTTTSLHLGFSHEEGGIAGLRFLFKF